MRSWESTRQARFGFVLSRRVARSMDVISKGKRWADSTIKKRGENTYPNMQTFNKALSFDPLPTRLWFLAATK